MSGRRVQSSSRLRPLEPVVRDGCPCAPMLEPLPCAPILEPLLLGTEAGEVLKPQKGNGLWFPVQTNSCHLQGSACLALDIALSPERIKLAVSQLEVLIYNSSTVASKESYFNLWTSICQALKLPSLPGDKELSISSCFSLGQLDIGPP